MKDIIDVSQSEREVLEHEQQAHVVNHSRRQNAFFRFPTGAKQTEPPIDQYGDHHDEHENRLAPRVKAHARQQQDRVAKRPRLIGGEER